jgi:parallel beta-helix repeat protein
MRSFVSRSLTLAGLFMTTLAACGGGGGGGGNATPTPVVSNMLYVRASGSDDNDGKSPAAALRQIQTAVLLAMGGDTIIVGPGTYGRVDFDARSGIAGNPIVLIGDPSGSMTQDAPGAVRIVVDDGVFGIRLSRSEHIILDGFTISGATANNGAGIIVRIGSHNATIRNCELTGNADGVRVQDSDDLTLFNNLIAENLNRGAFIGASGTGAGSQRARVISNTVVVNGGAGIFIGNNEVASRDAVVRNNIFQDNEGRNFDVDNGPPSSADGLTADYNLVFKSESNPECSNEAPQSACGYGAVAMRGAHDVNADALFTAPNRQEFFLDQENSPAVDAGDPELEAGLADILRARTTAVRGNLDEDPIDLGYHAPQPEG